ncbi:uncharacterized protein LOC131663155 [Phymastichus coffea]|uniref:uncharacterized protein LOC131663155 n=1 Tax=Phymastichus coffea TaxID=108790 RepID=UPI00273CC0DD|nr:uncharacterized protein LOC131663155 [Phymastichus coffea]XP_058789308.1 uncharacterized protein LOC131663155 [Phymastichus coffea]XP_058789309.1 uncharacterized protein LOC131663155 [Phymastichus coffea]XP_058789310.1 uncharacterized protein LOC131663155 [Phymastichus coffea]XP_058789311.1 uncharacterized protein LOC131663155 [Phymastichus coffea]
MGPSIGTRLCWLLVAVSAIWLQACAGQVDWKCMPACKCFWVSGKKTAKCLRVNLTDELSPELQQLDLTGSEVTELGDSAFTRIHLDNLQKLVMRDCQLRVLNAGAFNGLHIIIEIDLSHNKLSQLHRGSFDQTERLRVLLLNHNQLQQLEDGLFHDLLFLQKVKLSDNHLVQVGQRSFHNLPGLTSLELDGNNLTHLEVASFEGLPKLGGLELRKNPWHCDCQLRAFRDWALQRKLYTRPTACALPPRLQGRAWDELLPEELACLGRVDALGARALSDASLLLYCRAEGSPRPRIAWVYRQRLLGNSTKRPASERGYRLRQQQGWANLTIPEPGPADRGEYICVASNSAGSVERNLSLPLGLAPGEEAGTRSGGDTLLDLRLALGLGLVAFVFLLLAITLCLCYCRRRRPRGDEKGQEAASLDQHGLGEQEKSLITAINPVVKPPRRYDAPSVTSHGTEMTELNRTLLDNDSVFADGVGSVVGVLANGLHEEELRGRASPELEAMMCGSNGLAASCGQHGGSIISGIGTLSRNTTPYRQYPPDLLAFSAGRNCSPTSQASTAPDNSRLQQQPSSPVPVGIVAAYTQIGFKTLPHPVRSSSATPYSLGHNYPSMPRHAAYGTIPRRPRAPSWSSVPPISPTERELAEPTEPVYDNLGVRRTADGSSNSVLSLNKSPEPGLSMRGRPLPATPTQTPGTPSSECSLPVARGPTQLFADRSAPEGASEWPAQEELRSSARFDQLSQQVEEAAEAPSPAPSPAPAPAAREDKPPSCDSPSLDSISSSTPKKVPPRPPPKPKKKSANGPLYEDEGEDGTEV